MTDFLASIENSGFSTWIRESNSIWAYPTVLTLHTIGLGILVGAAAALDIRLLGFGRNIPLEGLRPLFKTMWIGFWVNAVTGVVLLAADATSKVASAMFLIKLTLIALGVAVIIIQRRTTYADDVKEIVVTPTAKSLAVLSLAVWLIAIGAGRLMAYPGLFFGI